MEQILASHPKVRGLGERVTLNEAIAEVCQEQPPFRHCCRNVRRTGRALNCAGLAHSISKPLAAACRPARPALQISCRQTSVAGLIHAALPNARIIHTRRDPIDTCLSIFSILFSGHSQLYSYDLGELGRYYRAYEKVMAHWRNVLPPGVMLEVRYEEVVDNLEQQARQIIAHCGLEWDDACLEFYKADRPVRTISHAQVRQPIYRSSVDARARRVTCCYPYWRR